MKVIFLALPISNSFHIAKIHFSLGRAMEIILSLWMFISFSLKKKRTKEKEKVVAAQFSLKECAVANVVLPEN